MSLEVHHLHLSQSERIVWLLEEMQVPYNLTVHERDPQTALAPQGLKSIHSLGTAPFFQDTSVQPAVALAESGAIVEYILTVYGPQSKGTRLSRQPGDADYAPYLQWLHFANGSLQPNFARQMGFLFADVADTPIGQRWRTRLSTQLRTVDDQLANNKFLAGNELTAADVMSVFTLTTMRGFFPFDLGPFKNILRYLEDIVARPAYMEAVRKGDHDMKPMIEPVTRRFTQFAGMKSMLEKAQI